MSGEIRSFQDLIAWQKAVALCKLVYEASGEFPDRERFGLTSQIRRAVVSVPSNIAECYGRRKTQDYLRFLEIARGSLCEIETQLILARELSLATEVRLRSCFESLNEVRRVLAGLIKAIEDRGGD